MEKINRLYYDDENLYSWLPMLLDAYHIVDTGIDQQLIAEHSKGKVACKKGCCNCCLKPDVPITEIEIAGLSWYCQEQMEEKIKVTLIKRLHEHNNSLQCPFLINSICSVYPLRPLACRHFIVFGEPCVKDVDPSIERPHDIYHTDRKISCNAALRILPYWEIIDPINKISAFESGFIFKVSKPMFALDWKAFASRIISRQKNNK